MQTVSCPDSPEVDYPRAYPLPALLHNWNPDVTDIPAMHYDSFCRFDYLTQRKQIEAYREAHVPVVITNVPQVTEAVRKWSDFDYLNVKLGPYVPYVTETSKNNHFMFSRGKSYREHMKLLIDGPTGMAMSTFEDWLRDAVVEHNHTLAERRHQYFHIVGTAPDRHWLYDELPIFRPESEFFHASPSQVRVVSAQGKGINCRFGMRGVIAGTVYGVFNAEAVTRLQRGVTIGC